jgi:hypothetical protein
MALPPRNAHSVTSVHSVNDCHIPLAAVHSSNSYFTSCHTQAKTCGVTDSAWFLIHFFSALIVFSLGACRVFQHVLIVLRCHTWFHEESKAYHVRFHVLMAASMKMAAFWDIALCSLIEIDWHFRDAYCPHFQLIISMIMDFWNVGLLLQDYMMQCPWRLPSFSGPVTLFCASPHHTIMFHEHTWVSWPPFSHVMYVVYLETWNLASSLKVVCYKNVIILFTEDSFRMIIQGPHKLLDDFVRSYF